MAGNKVKYVFKPKCAIIRLSDGDQELFDDRVPIWLRKLRGGIVFRQTRSRGWAAAPPG
jgi:hypothetical protein